MKIQTSLGWVLLAVGLAGCASKSNVVQPEPLRKIAEPEVRSERVWSASMSASRDLVGLRPLLAAGRVFTGDRAGRISARDAQGQLLWSVDTGLRLSAGPALADGALIFGTLDGQAVAFAATDGAERWRSTLTSEVISLPVGVGDLVVVRSGDGRIYGLGAADGARRWTLNHGVPALTLRGAPALVSDGTLAYVGTDNGRVMAVDLASGETRWEEVVSLPTGRSELERLVDVDAELLLVSGVLFAASYGGDLVALAADSGRTLWRRSLASVSGMDLDEQCLYITDTESVLWCLDTRNGAALWKQEQLKHRGLSAPKAYKGNVLVVDFEGYMHAVSAAGGKIVGRTRIGKAPVRTPMQLLEDQLLVVDQGGRIQVLDWKPLSSDS